MNYSLLLRRVIVLSLTASLLLLSIVPDTAYASAPVPNVSPSTPFDASFPDDFIGSGLPDADYPMTKYEQSFEYCPKTIDDVLNPKSRFALSTTLIYIFTVILAACGIYISVEDSIVSIFTSFESWLRTNYGNNASVMITWQDILNGAVAGTIVGMRAFIPIFKKYLNSSIDGYGTGTSDFIFNAKEVVTEPFFTYADPTLYKGYNYATSLKFCNAEYNRDYYWDFFLQTTDNVVVILSGITNRVVTFYSYDSVLNDVVLEKFILSSLGYQIDSGKYFYPSSNFQIRTSYSYNPVNIPDSLFVKYSSFLAFDSKSSALSYFVNGNTDGLITFDGTAITADKSWSDLQTKDDATNIDYGDALVIPSAQDAIDQILAALAAAESAKAAAEALAPSITVTDTSKPAEGEDDEAQKLPWFPAISKWLTGIQAGVDSLGEQITTFPDTMADIKDSIISIPGQITDFFTIDTAVISASFTGLQEAFSGRFSGITQLANVFNRNYSFDIVYPVINMHVPAEPPILRQMFGGKSEIVFLDLNPFADFFISIRKLLIAFFWVAFVFWLLDEFDVKFHIS